LDFVLHSIGMSPNVRKGKAYDDLNYDWYHQTLDISAMSFHRMMQAASKTNALAEHASVVALSYIAAQRVFPGYGDMADAKALLESIGRSWGYYLGMSKKVRVNTVSQSPTKTTAGAGIKGFGGFLRLRAGNEPAGQRPRRRLRGILHQPLQRPDPLRHHAEPLPRRGLQQQRCHPKVMDHFMGE
jgi:enoyl-[acyl-carrier protein] reductase I